MWSFDDVFLNSPFAKLDLHTLNDCKQFCKDKNLNHSFEMRFLLKHDGVTRWCTPILNLQVNPRTLKLSHTNLQLRWITSIFYFEIHHPERGATCIYTRCSVFFGRGFWIATLTPKHKKKQLLDISVASFFFAQTPISLFFRWGKNEQLIRLYP